MKPNLLNSIYYKLSQTEDGIGLQSAANNYVKKVFMLYLELLDQAGVDDLNEKVKVRTEFANSKVLETECTAGEHLIEALLHSDDFENEMNELDQDFLNSCDCENKEGILHRIKAILSDVGSESIEKSDWLDAVNGMQNCKDYVSEEKFFDLDDF
jgi:hypothetical protein